MVWAARAVGRSTSLPGDGTIRRRLSPRRISRLIAISALGILTIQIILAFLGPLLTRWSPFEQDIASHLLPPGDMGHILGTDQVGRDELTRVLVGGRYSLGIALTASVGAAILGTSVGLFAGYRGGSIGGLAMRIAEAQASFPFIVIAIAIVAVLGASIPNLIGVLVLWGWVGFARVIFGQTLSVRVQDFVDAARAVGAPDLRIVVRHILPNVRSPALVVWTFTMAQMLIAESSLSFLGMGVQPPLPSWGSMLAESRSLIFVAWWTAIFPGVAIVLAVLAINSTGDALRDLWDPRLRV